MKTVTATMKAATVVLSMLLVAVVLVNAVVGVPQVNEAPAACKCRGGIAMVPDIAAYMFALQLESWWTSARPKTRSGFERYMWLSTKHDILPSQSCWGYMYELKMDERMTQYLILGIAPLDVVYDANDRVVGVFRSYE